MFAYEDGTRTQYEIPASNYAKFEAAVAKLSKRSVKLGLDPITPLIFDRFKKPVSEKKPDGEQYLVYRVLFTVEPIKLNGWKFVARIDHSNEAGNIVRPMPNSGVEVPTHYRTVEPNCDHCKVRRYRRDTFIVCQEETGDFHQVGSSCLADFLGHDPYRVARMAEFLGYADEAARASQDFIGGGDYRWVDVEEYLIHAAWAVRRHGWVSRKVAREREDMVNSTADRAMENCYPQPKHKPEATTDEDRANAVEALAWAQSLRETAEREGRELSDYEFNVSVIGSALMIEPRSIGIAASIVGVYLKNKARETEAEARRRTQRDSKHFGAVGDRVKAISAKMLTMFPVETHYGTFYIYTFLTHDGNVVKWKASNKQNIVTGTEIKLTGTIKAHNHYKEIAQTEFTRCKVEVVPVVGEKIAA